MSVVLTSDLGVVLDHQQQMNSLKVQMKQQISNKEEKSVHQTNKLTQHSNRTICDDLFDLNTPFLMDGEAKKIADKMDGTDCVKAKKKKRKLDTASSEYDVCSPSTVAEVKHVREVYEAMRVLPDFTKHFNFSPSSENFRENNRKVREARKYCTEASNQTLTTMDEINDGSLRLKSIDDHTYIIPANTRFICDDVRNIQQYCLRKVDLLVMDPPWWNGYVRRRNKNHGMHHGYDMLSVKDILSIPVHEILNEGALVAIWCTNNISIIKEFLDGLKQAWDVDLIATWYWLKLTKSGDPVTSLNENNFSHSKRAYERVLIARRTRKESIGSLDVSSDDCLPSVGHNIEPPEGKVICSVPSGIHSHKPYLGDLLLPYVKDSYEGVATEVNSLELFARSLYPGWTSYGKEVLKLQHTCLFTDSSS